MEQTTENIPEPSKKYLQALKKNFNLEDFKPGQWSAIRAILKERRDVCITAGSAYGKSLVYLFPPVYLNKKCIVIVNQISLMESAVWKLNQMGIKACYFADSLKDLSVGPEATKESQFIFATAVSVKTVHKYLRKQNMMDEICLIAMDEVHCVSKYSCDYRKLGKKLSSIRKYFPSISSPIVVMSSTMDSDVENDVISYLQLENPLRVRGDFDRPNLQYFARWHTLSDFMETARPFLEEVAACAGSAIVYSLRREDTEKIAYQMTMRGYLAKPYHSLLPVGVRVNTLIDFMSGELKFIVATNGLGSGIDKSDVRLVLHTYAPKAPQVYYQESGRAGRDGKPAKCVLLYNSSDFNLHTYCINQDFLKGDITQAEKDKRENASNNMRMYTMMCKCLREWLLSAVDSEHKSSNINKEQCCDVCTKIIREKVALHLMFTEIDSRGAYNATRETRNMLSIVNSYKGNCTTENLMNMLLGVQPTTFSPFHPLRLFRSGKSKPREWHDHVKNMLAVKNMIAYRNRLITVTARGKFTLRHKNRRTRFRPSYELCEKYLTKSETEYYVENDVVKSRPRVDSSLAAKKEESEPKNIVLDKKTLENIKKAMKRKIEGRTISASDTALKTPKLAKDSQPGCSKWISSKESSDTDSDH